MNDPIAQSKKLVEFQEELYNATRTFHQQVDALNKEYGKITFGQSHYNPISITMILYQNLDQLYSALSRYQVSQNLVNQLAKDQNRSKMTTAFKKDKSAIQIVQSRIQETLQDLQAQIYQTLDGFAHNFKDGITLATEQISEVVISKSNEIVRAQLSCNPLGATQSLNNLFFTGNVTADSVRKQVFKFSSQPQLATTAEHIEDVNIDLNKID